MIKKIVIVVVFILGLGACAVKKNTTNFDPFHPTQGFVKVKLPCPIDSVVYELVNLLYKYDSTVINDLLITTWENESVTFLKISVLLPCDTPVNFKTKKLNCVFRYMINNNNKFVVLYNKFKIPILHELEAKGIFTGEGEDYDCFMTRYQNLSGKREATESYFIDYKLNDKTERDLVVKTGYDIFSDSIGRSHLITYMGMKSTPDSIRTFEQWEIWHKTQTDMWKKQE